MVGMSMADIRAACGESAAADVGGSVPAFVLWLKGALRPALGLPRSQLLCLQVLGQTFFPGLRVAPFSIEARSYMYLLHISIAPRFCGRM